MKKLTCAVALVLSMACSVQAQVDMAFWDMQAPNTPADSAGTNSSNVLASSGIYAGSSILNGVHAVAATSWTTPVGNGSTDSYNSNNWSVGDYWQFKTSTLGYVAINVTWDQTRSSTGPGDFTLSWSTDGTNFTNVLNYVVQVNAAPNTPWTQNPPRNPFWTFGPVDLPKDTWNKPDLWVRLTSNVAGAAAGTNRIDNVQIRSPEPATLGLLAIGSLLFGRRRMS